MERLIGKAVVAQGGGPTAVINQSVCGVALEARRYPEITHVYGSLHGVAGIVAENFLELSLATEANLRGVAETVSAGLRSTRDKPDVAYCRKIFKVFQAHHVRYFFYCGGNDSADTCRIVSEEAAAAGYELVVIHVPKTIDNDLRVTDHCPGYGSAARYVASAFMGANLDNRAIPGVYLGVVMGRHAGFLTAASVLGRKYPDDGPHLVYLPEQVFRVEEFLGAVETTMQRHGRCVIAVSEGVVNERKEPLIVALTGKAEKDAHGNVQLSGSGALGDLLANELKVKLKIKRVRADTFGYLQRCFPGVVSPVDAREAREVGEQGVQFAVRQKQSGSVALRRVGDYAIEYFLTPLATVARETKPVPAGFMDGPHGISRDFVDYALPLLGPLPNLERVAAPAVKKLLNP